MSAECQNEKDANNKNTSSLRKENETSFKEIVQKSNFEGGSSIGWNFENDDIIYEPNFQVIDKKDNISRYIKNFNNDPKHYTHKTYRGKLKKIITHFPTSIILYQSNKNHAIIYLYKIINYKDNMFNLVASLFKKAGIIIKKPFYGNVYTGQTYNIKRRHKDHFKKNSSKSDKVLRLLKKNTDITLELSIIDIHSFHVKNIILLNRLEKKYVREFNTYYNGANLTEGGAGVLQPEKHHKLYKDLIHYGTIWTKKTGLKLGACPRNEIINDYQLGEEIHRLRSNDFIYIRGDPERMEKLNKLGWTESSKEAGVNRCERSGKSRSNNNWKKIKPILESIYNEFGHLNYDNEFNNIDGIDDLLKKTNYKSIKGLLAGLRGNLSISKDKQEWLKNKNFFNRTNDWNNFRFDKGLEWYYNNEKFRYPPQGYTIPNNNNIPKYLHNLNLGSYYSNRTRLNTLTSKAKQLIKENEYKPKRNIKEHYTENPDKKKIMVNKVSKSHSERDWTLRSISNILNMKFDSNIIFLETLPTDCYYITHAPIVKGKNKRNKFYVKDCIDKQYKTPHRLFMYENKEIGKGKGGAPFVSKMWGNLNEDNKNSYKDKIEKYRENLRKTNQYKFEKTIRYNQAINYKLRFFYLRKWYYLTKLSKYKNKD